MRNIFVAFTLLAVLLATPQAGAAPIVLKEYNAPGYTFCDVGDTLISNYNVGETQYNHGGEKAPSNLYEALRPFLIQFDLTAIPDAANVASVNSATLRIYRIKSEYNNRNIRLAQMAESWIPGTSSGTWDGVCDGATWWSRNAGTVVPKASLASAGSGIYYIDGVTSLANDPVNAGKKYVRLAGSNFNNAQNSYTGYASLADLQAAGTTRGYYWDSVAGRLYLNKNDQNVRWYSAADMWNTPGGEVTGGYMDDASYPGVPATTGWVEWDVTAVATNWLVGGQGAYGFRIIQQTSSASTFATSDYTADMLLRPELVLDVTYVPEPASLALLALAGVGAMLRRRC